MRISEFQQKIRDIYFERDSARGILPTFVWLVEEIGELARETRRDDKTRLEEEFSDVFAWLVSLASQMDIDLERAAGRFASGCPKCGETPCGCK